MTKADLSDLIEVFKQNKDFLGEIKTDEKLREHWRFSLTLHVKAGTRHNGARPYATIH